MAYIDNTQTKVEMNDAMRGNSVSNIAPTRISDVIQPVININPKDYRRINIVKSRTNAGTVYTTPTDKDFYLAAIFIGGSSITAGANAATISAIIEGDTSSTALASLKLSNTVVIDATSGNIPMTFPLPIKLAKGSAISSATGGTFAAVTFSIYGYTVEN
jgi:hypothetical protein